MQSSINSDLLINRDGWVVGERTPTDLRLTRGEGVCGWGAPNPIPKKLRENCSTLTKPPEASRSNTSAHGTHRAPKNTQGGQAKSNCGKIAENRGKLRETAVFPNVLVQRQGGLSISQA